MQPACFRRGGRCSASAPLLCTSTPTLPPTAPPPGRVAGAGCPQCAGYVLRGRTTLSEHSPDLAAEWHPRNDASPDQFGPGSQRKVWWRCPVGHEYQA
ncbi:zinc-ribbon domain-containing protein [Streptomyces pharetrae]|uniref:zinc-ribbon domain-containing protein n=1 Tax=Streptomyces pharetrae TaxID=291370 RepID=UPI003460C65D